MRILQHDMLVLSVTPSSTGAVCIERKSGCVLLSSISGTPFETPLETQQHVINKIPKTMGSIEQQTHHASSHISSQKHHSKNKTIYLHSNKQIKIVKPSAE